MEIYTFYIIWEAATAPAASAIELKRKRMKIENVSLKRLEASGIFSLCV